MDSTSISTRLDDLKINLGILSFPMLLILLFVGSFLIHLLIVTIFMNQPVALDDMFQYDMLARSLKAGNGFRWYSKADVEILRPYYSQFLDIDHLPFPVEGLKTAFRAPGYPFFLAFIYFFVPESLRLIFARLVQAIAAGLLAPLAAVLCHQIGFSGKVTVLSAIGVSLYPILLFYPVGLASENLYILLGMLSVLALHRSTHRHSWRWVLLAGLLSGLTMFTRSIFAVFTLLSACWLCRFSPLKKKAGLIFLLTAFGVCLPWSIRNSLIMQKPAFVENSVAYNMFIGYHPQGDGGFVSRIAIIPMNILDDGERERFCMQQALEFIRQNPIESARRILVRLVKFIGPEDREFFFFYSNNLLGAIPQPWLALVYALLLFPWGFTLLFGVLGLWLSRHHQLTFLVILLLIGYALPHLFIIAEPRFHLAFVPLLMPFAAHAWVSKRKIQWRWLSKKEYLLITAILMLLTILFISGFALNLPTLISIMSEGGNKLSFSY